MGKRWRGLWVVGGVLLCAAVVLLIVPAPGGGRGKFGMGLLGELVDDVGDAVSDGVEEIVEKHFEDPLVSPFEDVEWVEKDGVRVVRVKVDGGDGGWYGLEAVEGWGTAELLAFIEKEHGADKVEKRFEEDLPQVLREGWKKPGPEVLLRLRGADGGVVEQRVRMTEANRRRLWEKRGGGAGPAVVENAAAVVDELAALLRGKHSYGVLRGVDDALVAEVKGSLGVGERPERVGAALMRLLAATGDGHAGVEVGAYPDAGPWMQALMMPIGFERGDAVVAVKPDRSGFLEEGKPRVLAVDGVEIEKWIEAAGADVVKGSVQLVRERSLRGLRSVGVQRARLGVAGEAGFAVVRVAGMDGEGAVDVRVPIAARKPVFGEWPRGESGMVAVSARPPNEFGYVRLGSMPSERAALRKLGAELREHGACGRLVIDLRGNGGGARDAIEVLGEFLLPVGSGPVVYNAARGLVLPGEGEAEVSGRLASRMLHPADDGAWTAAERGAIAAFAAGFRPEVEAPEGRFSAWHYAVVSKRGEGAAYGGRVVVLMDERCFSAADVCLAALREIGKVREKAGMPGVTLMGQPSAGGSGLTREHRIGGGRVRVRLSTMVSYMPDGRLFDGSGVAPDVEVRPIPLNFTAHTPRAKADGTGDAMMEAALRHLASPEQP